MILEIDETDYEEQVLLDLFIKQLPKRDRAIVEMYRDRYSYKEIAKEVELSERQIIRILERFKERWEKGE